MAAHSWASHALSSLLTHTLALLPAGFESLVFTHQYFWLTLHIFEFSSKLCSFFSWFLFFNLLLRLDLFFPFQKQLSDAKKHLEGSTGFCCLCCFQDSVLNNFPVDLLLLVASLVHRWSQSSLYISPSYLDVPAHSGWLGSSSEFTSSMDPLFTMSLPLTLLSSIFSLR